MQRRFIYGKYTSKHVLASQARYQGPSQGREITVKIVGSFIEVYGEPFPCERNRILLLAHWLGADI